MPWSLGVQEHDLGSELVVANGQEIQALCLDAVPSARLSRPARRYSST